MQFTTALPIVGMDIAKSVFQLHLVDPLTGEIKQVKLKRDRVSNFFANHPQSLIAMEACGGAHHWARAVSSLGHVIRLLTAKHVFVRLSFGIRLTQEMRRRSGSRRVSTIFVLCR